MIFLDQQWYDDPAREKQFHYLTTGQAVFETILYEKGILWFWERHLDRLQKSLQLFRADSRALDFKERIMSGLKRLPDPQSARIKLVVLAPFNSGPVKLGPEHLIVQIDSPALPETAKTEVALKTFPSPLNPRVPLAGYKTINYGHFYFAREQAARLGADDVLFLDPEGYLLESSIANIFAVKDGRIFTPPADGFILPGTVRGALIDYL